MRGFPMFAQACHLTQAQQSADLAACSLITTLWPELVILSAAGHEQLRAAQLYSLEANYMQGMSVTTGKALSGIAHLKQSIRDILTTPIGSRVMRRDYGSRLFELIDKPTTDGFQIELYAATAEALQKWESRFRLEKVSLQHSPVGKITLALEGFYLPDGKPINLDGIVVS